MTDLSAVRLEAYGQGYAAGRHDAILAAEMLTVVDQPDDGQESQANEEPMAPRCGQSVWVAEVEQSAFCRWGQSWHEVHEGYLDRTIRNPDRRRRAQWADDHLVIAVLSARIPEMGAAALSTTDPRSDL